MDDTPVTVDNIAEKVMELYAPIWERLAHETERHQHWVAQSRGLEESNRFLLSQIATLKAEVEMLRIANAALTEMINLRKEPDDGRHSNQS